jgi:hypothetical protein
MGLALFGLLRAGENLSAWILTPAGVLLGGGVYFAALFLLRVPELRAMVSGVKRRLRTK